jgi:hypothetical protein
LEATPSNRLDYRSDTGAGVTLARRGHLLLANIALRGVVDQSVFRTVGPEDPLSVGGVYGRRRAARRIHGPAFLR